MENNESQPRREINPEGRTLENRIFNHVYAAVRLAIENSTELKDENKKLLLDTLPDISFARYTRQIKVHHSMYGNMTDRGKISNFIANELGKEVLQDIPTINQQNLVHAFLMKISENNM